MDIEEDIKIINNFVQNIENGFVTSSVISSWNPEKRIVKAIEHLLAEREEAKKRIEELEDRCKSHQKLLYMAAEVEQNSILKPKVKEILEDIEDYFDRLNGPDEDMEYIRNKKKELLEDK